MLYRDSTQSSKTGRVMQARDNGVLKERERTVPVDGYLEGFVHLFISTSVFPDLPKSDMRFYLKIPNPNFFISVTGSWVCFLVTYLYWTSSNESPNLPSSGTFASEPYPRMPPSIPSIIWVLCSIAYPPTIFIHQEIKSTMVSSSYCPLTSPSLSRIREGSPMIHTKQENWCGELQYI